MITGSCQDQQVVVLSYNQLPEVSLIFDVKYINKYFLEPFPKSGSPKIQILREAKKKRIRKSET